MRGQIPTKKVRVLSLEECLKIDPTLLGISKHWFKEDLADRVFKVDNVPGEETYLIIGFVVPVEFCKDVK